LVFSSPAFYESFSPPYIHSTLFIPFYKPPPPSINFLEKLGGGLIVLKVQILVVVPAATSAKPALFVLAQPEIQYFLYLSCLPISIKRAVSLSLHMKKILLLLSILIVQN